jgi:hypothetical protein
MDKKDDSGQDIFDGDKKLSIYTIFLIIAAALLVILGIFLWLMS